MVDFPTLESLKLCLDTNGLQVFTGDIDTALPEIVDTLLEYMNKDSDRENYKADFEDAQLAIQQAMEQKEHIMQEYEGCKQLKVDEMDRRFEEILDILGRCI